MEIIRIEYTHKNKPYQLKSGIFDINHLYNITEIIQNRYSEFAKRINVDNGYIILDISHTPNTEKSIHFEARVMVNDKNLTEDIHRMEEMKPHILP
ncbi:MAG TPA: hypothetical protein VMU83_13875 [Hanamia sp.]|nr:hypothetical protein [Hanamia sp.]